MSQVKRQEKMVLRCARGGLGWTSEFIFFHRRSCKALEQTAQGSGGITICESAQNTFGYGTWGSGIVLNMVVVLG